MEEYVHKSLFQDVDRKLFDTIQRVRTLEAEQEKLVKNIDQKDQTMEAEAKIKKRMVKESKELNEQVMA